MSGFSQWVKRQLELRPHQSVPDAARALKIRPSELHRWLGSKRPPTQATMRTVSRVFDVPIREVLIAADYMTAEESLSPAGLATATISTQELLTELSRRGCDTSACGASAQGNPKADQGTAAPNT